MTKATELAQLGGLVNVTGSGTSAKVGIGTTLDITGGLVVGGIQVISTTGVWQGSSAGIQGAQGTTGTQGTTGIQGATGAQGTTGAQGATGSQGTTGTQGTAGTQGATGPVGGSNTQILYNSSGTATGSANMTFDGTRPTFATLRTDSILPVGGLPGGASGGGIVQVVSVTKSDTFFTDADSFQDVTGLSLSITPRSSSNKILVIVQLFVATTWYTGLANIVRNSTNLLQGDAAGSRATPSFSFVVDPGMSNNHGETRLVTRFVLDSPATTSATTYKVQVVGRPDNENNGGIYINRTSPDRNTGTYDHRGASSIVAMEVSA
jgi:hypothetical protein